MFMNIGILVLIIFLAGPTLGQGSEGHERASVQVNSCCPAGQVLKLSRNPRRGSSLFEPKILAKCVRKRTTKRNGLDERTLQLTDLVEDENGTLTQIDHNVTLTQSKMPSCTVGLQISFIANHSAEADAAVCRTDSGASSNKCCIFPFKYDGVVYNECTMAGAYMIDGKPWCSTKVDRSGNHIGNAGNWGNCEEGCPVEVLSTTPITMTTTNDYYDYDEDSYEYDYEDDDEDGYDYDEYEEPKEDVPKISVLKHKDCYEVKGDYRLYSDAGEWEEIPYISKSTCESRAKAEPRYVGWSYANGWADSYCYLFTRIRRKGHDSDFISGLSKDNCEHHRVRRSIHYDTEARQSVHYDTDDARIRVTRDGVLVSSNLSLSASQFCLADQWEGDVSDVEDLSSEYIAVGLSCEPCKSKVSCLLVSLVFETFSHGSYSIKSPPLLIDVFDKNGDREVNFEEFTEKSDSFLKQLLATQDDENDGKVDKNGTPLISLKLFLTLANMTFEIFDKNGDDVIFEPDSEGNRWILSFLAGKSPIQLPYPLFLLYTKINPDRNGELTLQEVTEFITNTFAILDKNNDCLISLDEVISTLAECKLPAMYQLPVQLLGEQYLDLTRYFIEQVVDITDQNKDGKMTAEELQEFGDFSRLDTMINVARDMSGPNHQTLSFLLGNTRGQDREEVMELWLNTLENFLGLSRPDNDKSSNCVSTM